jgi:hypothetical protein
VSVNFDIRDVVTRTYLIQPGIISVFRPGLYMEVVYGVGFDEIEFQEVGNVRQEGFWELTYEGANALFAGRIKFAYFHDTNFFFVIPSVTGGYFTDGPWGIVGKYFFSIDREKTISNALLIENRFRWNDTIGSDFLLAGTHYIYDGEPVNFDLSKNNADATWHYEVGARITVNFNEDIALKYLFNYIGEDGNHEGMQNVLTLDVKF